MGLLTRRRRAPAPLDLQPLLALSGAEPTLRAGGLRPSGVGAVCVNSGAADQLDAIVGGDRDRYDDTTDTYGYRWLTRRTGINSLAGLTDDLHAVALRLEAAEVRSSLMCAVVGFTDGGGSPVGLVYSFTRAAWYPFAPSGDSALKEARRDSQRELQVRGMLGDSLKVEPDLTKWFPVWGAPGL